MVLTCQEDNPANQNGQAEKEAEAVEALEVHPEGKQNKGNVTGPEQSGFFSILIFQSILLSSAEEPQERRQRKGKKRPRAGQISICTSASALASRQPDRKEPGQKARLFTPPCVPFRRGVCRLLSVCRHQPGIV